MPGIDYGTYAIPRLDLGQAMNEWVGPSLFIAPEVLPIFGTPQESATFSKITRESMLKTENAQRAANGAYNTISIGAEDDNYKTVEYGLKGNVDDRKRALFSSDFDLELETAKQVRHKLNIAYEKRAATLVFNTTTWAGATLFTNLSTDWDNIASTPIQDIIAAKEKVRVLTGMEPNVLILNKENINRLRVVTQILDAIKYTQMTSFNAVVNALASLFDLERIIVAGGVENTAAQGQAASISDIWSDDYAMVAVIDSSGSLEVPTLGKTFLWTTDSPSEMVVESYRNEDLRKDIIRVRHNLDEKIFDPSFAHLMQVDT